MKRIILFNVLLVLMIFIGKAQYNVLGLGCSGVGPVPRITYERTFTTKISLILGFEMGRYSHGSSADGYNSMEEVANVKGWGIMPELRLYPFSGSKKAPLGAFIGIHYRYRRITEHYFERPYNFKTDAKAYNYGINIGYRSNIDKVTFDFLCGIGKSDGVWATPNNRDVITSDLLKEDLTYFVNHIRLEISIGFLFPFKKYKLELSE